MRPTGRPPSGGGCRQSTSTPARDTPAAASSANGSSINNPVSSLTARPTPGSPSADSNKRAYNAYRGRIAKLRTIGIATLNAHTGDVRAVAFS